MQKIRLMALGGLDEDGKNCYLIELDNDIFVVETGLKYPNESEQLGIECIIPDFSYLIENKDRVKAVFISHGHDDNMKALSYLLKEIDVDVYATPLTAKLIEEELLKHGIRNKRVRPLKRQDTIRVAGHTIYSFPLMQSIADGIGLAFKTDYGLIVYASEFIFDYDFTNEAFSLDINVLSDIGQSNVLALLAESVGSTRSGYTTPKHRITEHIEHYFENNSSRILITLYKQNLFRIIEILELAHRYKRRVFFYNDEHVRLLKQVEDLGYYKLPVNILVSKEEFSNDMDDVIVVISGSGNKVFKLMNNIAIGEDSIIELREEDMVIIASPIVPGTEKEASAMENDLYRAGVTIVKLSPAEILSMHSSIEDLKMILSLIKPKYYIPVKGDFAALIGNAEIATAMGLTPDRIVILDNGQFALFENGKLVSVRETIELNDVSIDGTDSDIAGSVLKDRGTLSTDGIIVVGVVLDHGSKALVGGPDIQSRGVIYLKDADHILEQISEILLTTIADAVKENRYENLPIRQEAREKISRYILRETGKKPMILPVIVEINTGE